MSENPVFYLSYLGISVFLVHFVQGLYCGHLDIERKEV